MRKRATAEDSQGHGKEIIWDFAKDGALKMLAMLLTLEYGGSGCPDAWSLLGMGSIPGNW